MGKAAFKKAQAEKLATTEDKEKEEERNGKRNEEYETFTEEYPDEDDKKEDSKADNAQTSSTKEPSFWSKISDSILEGQDIVTASKRMASNFTEGLRDAAQDLFGMKEKQDSMKKQLYTPTKEN